MRQTFLSDHFWTTKDTCELPYDLAKQTWHLTQRIRYYYYTVETNYQNLWSKRIIMTVDILLITCKKNSDHSHRESSENKHRLVCRQSRADNRDQACQKDRSSGLQKRPNMDPSDTEINFMTISYKWQPKDWSSLCVTVYESRDYSRSFRSLRWSLERCFSNCYPQICSNTLTPMWVTLERVSRQLTSRRVLEFKETTNTTTNTSDYAGLNKISNWFSITLSSHFGADRKRLVQQKITVDCLGSRLLILPVIQTQESRHSHTRGRGNLNLKATDIFEPQYLTRGSTHTKYFSSDTTTFYAWKLFDSSQWLQINTSPAGQTITESRWHM